LHIPIVPVSAHDTQLPVQAEPQQTPWAQKLLWQSPAAAQLAPIGRSPHEPPLQTFGGAQSASAAQVDLHAATPHLKGKQELGAGVTQTPAPSHDDAGVSVMPLAGQLAAPHGVPGAYSWQAPAAHLPFVPQVPGLSTQVCDGSGLLAGTLVQSPSEFDSAHDLQAVAQAVEQQTPWAQLFEAHSLRSEQKAPIGFSPHELPTQNFPGAQLASAVQTPKHLPPLHA
jgi:hypothetical protein